ncbi:hypothetical protein BD410DRAFT_614739 [Rickenella mellea]|uniref:Uncharacterized protein n=1 Tax=Rickenella mellea TaxID=50990 RepID=A0A4Y7PPB4_9AGAM|nr:hypothetical protein BD410DRAFT_614739 [Rickenella mellea]
MHLKRQLRVEHSLPYTLKTSECVYGGKREDGSASCLEIAISKVTEHFLFAPAEIRLRDDNDLFTQNECILQRGARWSAMVADKSWIQRILICAGLCGTGCLICSSFPSGTTDEMHTVILF